ncbi:hypothetical protein ACFLS1_05710 [Verrucomicrobiota bacterium]
MRRITINIFFVVLLCLLAATCNVCAKTLIVTKKGVAIWATNVRQTGNIIKYSDITTGSQKSISISELHGVIPTIQRGNKYDPTKVQGYIARIKKLQEIHKNLYRQLNPLLQEWESLLKPKPELEDAILKCVSDFRKSDKSPKAYKSAGMELGMIKYKDVAGKYDDQINKLLDEIKTDFITVNTKHLEETANKAESITIDEYVDFKILAKNLIQHADEPEKNNFKKLLADTGDKACKALCAKAHNIFTKIKTIDAYLEGRRILIGVKENIVETDKQKELADQSIAKLLKTVSTFRPQYKFNENGYPFTRPDMTAMNKVGRFCSMVTFSDVIMKEQCFIIPKTAPRGITMRKPFSVQLNLIINRTQPKDRIFGIEMKLRGSFGMHTHIIKLEPVQFENGHAAIKYKENFSNVPDDFTIMAGEYGYKMYFHLVYLKDPDSKYPTWTPISKTCAWPIRP